MKKYRKTGLISLMGICVMSCASMNPTTINAITGQILRQDTDAMIADATAELRRQREIVIDRGPGKGDVRARVEIALKRRGGIGVDGRAYLSEDNGVFYDYGQDTNHRFWMSDNELIPLSIAFVLADGRILAIYELEPGDPKQYRSPVPSRYLLVMNKGWFAKNGIIPGHRLRTDQ